MDKRLIFLIGRHGGMTGRAEMSKGTVRIAAKGLPAGENIRILAVKKHCITSIGTIETESQKPVEWCGSFAENTDVQLVLCNENGPILWDGHLSNTDAAAIAARYWENEKRTAEVCVKHAVEAKTAELNVENQEMSLKTTENIPEYANETGMFRTNEDDEPVDLMPAYLWHEGDAQWARYFTYGEAAETPMDSDFKWRFVNAQAASGGNVYPCLLGRYAEKDSIRAMCMMIEDMEVPTGSIVPTFRHQKTPDGRGWFVRIWEV